MNSLSVFLYLASVGPRLATAIAWFFFLAMLGGIIGYITAFIMVIWFDDEMAKLWHAFRWDASVDLVAVKAHIDSNVSEVRKIITGTRRMSFWAVIVSLVLWLSTFLVPDQQTLYMIAGSQAGEQVINNPDTKELVGLVKDKIKDLLTPDEKPLPSKK